MALRIGWMTTLLLTALGLVMGGAHLLELPVRAEYDAQFYMQVTSSLYRYFGLVGGPLQVLALAFSLILVWRLRNRPAFRPSLAGSVCLALSLLLWFALVQPVNAAWSEALSAGSEEAVRAYSQLRGRWETGHVAAFTAWLMGFILLLLGLFAETANRQNRRSSSLS